MRDYFQRNDEEGLAQNIQFQLENGIDGIVVLGTTGETPCLSHEEKIRIIKIAKKATHNRASLIVGTGTYSTRETILHTQEALDLGADAALIVNPYYNKPTQEGIYRHYEAIASAVDIPIIVYHNPGRCGSNIALDTMQRLGDIPSIIGVKDCSGQLSFLTTLVEQIGKQKQNFSVMTGDDAWTFPCLSLRGDGVICVASNT